MLVGIREGKRPLCRPQDTCQNNIKMDVNGVKWIHLAQDRAQ
jgi:hypothetical protein